MWISKSLLPDGLLTFTPFPEYPVEECEKLEAFELNTPCPVDFTVELFV